MDGIRTRIWQSALGIVLVILLVSAVMITHAQSQGTVRGGELALRTEPSAEAESIGAYRTGTEVAIAGEEPGGWYLVRTPDGNEGYMEARHVFTSDAGLVENGGDFVNLRAEPSMEAEVIGEYGSGEELTLLSEDEEGWGYVRIGGVEGYMAMRFIAPAPEQAEAITADSILLLGDSEEILQAATPPAEQAPPAAETEQGLADHVRASSDGDNPSYLVEYPELSIQQADAQILAWVEAAVAQAEEAAQGGGQVELTARYDVAMLENRYIGLLETGFLSSDAFAHPTDLILTVNVDRETGGVLTYQELFTEGSIGQVVSLLAGKLANVEGNPLEDAETQPDEAWLRHAVLRPDGVAIVLPRSERLPSVWGTQTVLLPYAELQEAGLLALPIDAGEGAGQPEPDAVVG